MRKVEAPAMTRWEFSLWRFGWWFCLENKELYITVFYEGKTVHQWGWRLK